MRVRLARDKHTGKADARAPTCGGRSPAEWGPSPLTTGEPVPTVSTEPRASNPLW